MKGSKAQTPLIIYIAETDHHDLSYPSVTEKIIRECDEKGLRTSVFSEFGTKEKGWGSEDDKVAARYFSKDKINQFVNQRCIPTGNAYNRFTKLIPEVERSLPTGVTPSQIFEQRKDQIDNPEVLELLAAEIALRQQNQKDGIGKVDDRDLDGEGFWRKGNRNSFVQKATHQEMAEAITTMKTGQEDVVIVIAGASHIYGLDKALGSTFPNCEKRVVGNFKEFSVDLSSLESIEHVKGNESYRKKSCQMVGEVVGFEVSADQQASLPEAISTALSEVAESKKKSSWVQKLGLRDEGMEEAKAESDLQPKKSWVEKMRSDATKGKSLGGSHEL